MTALLGWRLGLAIAAGLLGCLVLEAGRASTGIHVGACLAILAAAVGAGLVWEVATLRARCGFRPLE